MVGHITQQLKNDWPMVQKRSEWLAVYDCVISTDFWNTDVFWLEKMQIDGQMMSTLDAWCPRLPVSLTDSILGVWKPKTSRDSQDIKCRWNGIEEEHVQLKLGGYLQSTRRESNLSFSRLCTHTWRKWIEKQIKSAFFRKYLQSQQTET